MKTIVALLSIALISMSLPGQSQSTSPRYMCFELKRMIRDAHAAQSTSPRYTHTELKRMIQDAQTAADFERLSVYFEDEADESEVKYRTEQDELDRLLALRFHARSYSLQVENTRNRMDHFKDLHRRYSEQATMFRASERKAAEGTSNVASPSL